MNAVIVAVSCMLVLSLCRVHVVISLMIGAFIGGLASHLSLKETINAFNTGISNGASIALSYALLGAFAVAISHSGFPQTLTNIAIKKLQSPTKKSRIKWILITIIGFVSIASQNIIPIHIAFIPILIPSLLYVMSKISLDRRAVACLITFGLIMPYMFLPIGFGNIFLKQILLNSVASAGLDTSNINIMEAMAIPAIGMFVGLLVAIFVTYRKPRYYHSGLTDSDTNSKMSKRSIIIAMSAIVLSFSIQLYTDSMILGPLVGFICFVMAGIVKWHEANTAFNDGIKMMAMVGFVMITAQGFAEVLKQSNDIDPLVNAVTYYFSDSKPIAALMILLIGLIVTIGIGSSFSTIPIIAIIFVPLCKQLDFSPLATICLIGTSGVIGDSGSPSSDTILSATAGLNADDQHRHIHDSVIPTFIHFNIPILLSGWLAALIL